MQAAQTQGADRSPVNQHRDCASAYPTEARLHASVSLALRVRREIGCKAITSGVVLARGSPPCSPCRARRATWPLILCRGEGVTQWNEGAIPTAKMSRECVSSLERISSHHPGFYGSLED